MATLASVIGVTTLLPPETAAGNNPVPIQADVLHDQLFSAHARLRARGTEGVRDLILSAELYGWRQLHADATQQQLTEHAGAMSLWFDANLSATDLTRPTYEFMMRGLNMLAAHPGAALTAPIVREVMDATVGREMKTYGSYVDQMAADRFRYSYYEQLYPIQDLIWGRIRRAGVADSTFGAVWDARFGTRLNVSVNASADQLMADPELATFINIQALMEAQNNQTTYLNRANEQLAAIVRRLNGGVDDQGREVPGDLDTILTQLQQLSLQFPAAPGGQRPTMSDFDAAKAAAANRQKYIDGAASAVQVLATLVGFTSNARSAAIVNGVGRAAVQIATAINNYLPTVAGLGLGAALTSLSTAAMTGNVVSAVTALLPVILGTQTPEQAIMNQLVEIRKDVGKLAYNMDQRFNRVERALSTIYSDMLSEFDKLINLGHGTRAQLGAIEKALEELTLKLDNWSAEVMHVARVQSLGSFNVAVNGKLNYESTYGMPLDYATGYVPAEAEFRTAAVTTSLAAPFVVPRGLESAPYDLGQVTPETAINWYKKDGAIAYLNYYAKQNYQHDGTFGPVADANLWVIAARAYTVLQQQNPDSARRVNPAVVSNILDVGEQILAGVQGLSRPNGTQTNQLFTQLVDQYWAAVEGFGQLAAQRRDTITGGKNYYMFWSADQPVPPQAGTAPSDPALVPPCTWADQPLSRPAQAQVNNIPGIALLARYINSQQQPIRLCHEASLLSQDPRRRGQWETTESDLQITFKVQVGWGNQLVDLRRWSHSWPVGISCKQYVGGSPTPPSGQYCYNASHYLPNWNSDYKAQFEQSAAYQDLAPAMHERVTRFITGQQATFYNRMVTEMETAGTALHQANQRITKAAYLLTLFTEVGFAQALKQDDLISMSLHGSRQIAADIGDRKPWLEGYRQAQRNFATCDPDPNVYSCRATAGPNESTLNQPYIDFWCRTYPMPNWMGDPVTDCNTQTAVHGTTLLRDRFAYYSGRIASGEHQEGPPEVANALATLRTSNTILRS